MVDDLTRQLDLDALRTGVRWRWGMVCAGAVLLGVGRSLGLTDLTPWIIVSFAVVGISANLLLIRILDLGWCRSWLTFVYCTLDLCLVGMAIVYLGSGGAIAGLFMVLVPCATRPGRALGVFALGVASAILFAAVILHGRLAGTGVGSAGSTGRAFLDLALVAGVATALVTGHTNLFRRITNVRLAIQSATSGAFAQHLPTTRNDSLGLVEQSLHELLGQIDSLVEAVRREIKELTVLGDVFAHSTSAAVETSHRVASVAAELGNELQDLGSAAAVGAVKCRDSVQDAQDLRSRAEGSAADVRELEDNAEVGRERISRAIETLMAVGKDLERTGRIVEEVSGLSRQIGSSAISIAKVARHTHILALNAAIEAARAKEHGDEFSVVADQVRTLAGEAGRSAREVGDLVSEVNAGIAAAASALAAGEEKVNEVSEVAGEGRSALARIRSGSVAASEFVSAMTVSFQSQAKSATSSADALSRMADAISRWSTEVQAASSEATAQISLLGELDRTCGQLTETGERLRQVVADFSGPNR